VTEGVTVGLAVEVGLAVDVDLDVIAGNNLNQINRLYLNNGTSDPFGGVVGSDISADAIRTETLALGDMDGDGDLDVVAGSFDSVVPNRLYLNPYFDATASLYNTAAGRIVSEPVDLYVTDISDATLTVTQSTPPNTDILYWLTNNGMRWWLARPGNLFTFPSTGSDLRWKAEMSSYSPLSSPALTNLSITYSQPIPTATPTSTPTFTATPTATPSPTFTTTPTATPSSTASPTSTISATSTATLTTRPTLTLATSNFISARILATSKGWDR